MNRTIYRLLSVFVMMMVFNAVQALTPRQTFDVQAPETAYGSTVKYGIFRNAKPVGEHTVEFRHADSGLQVMVESRIVVSMLKFPVFKFTYNAEEQWQDGVLLSVATVVVENGKTKKATLQRDGAEQTLVDTDGNRSRASLGFTSNHWHPGVLDNNALFNTLTGRANRYTLKEVGQEVLNTVVGEINATRYRYSGELSSDVWYDEQGRWVQLQFSADDGSSIEYRLASPFKSLKP